MENLNDSFKIYHDTLHYDIINEINKLLTNHKLEFKFVDGEFDGYDIVELIDNNKNNGSVA